MKFIRLRIKKPSSVELKVSIIFILGILILINLRMNFFRPHLQTYLQNFQTLSETYYSRQREFQIYHQKKIESPQEEIPKRDFSIPGLYSTNEVDPFLLQFQFYETLMKLTANHTLLLQRTSLSFPSKTKKLWEIPLELSIEGTPKDFFKFLKDLDQYALTNKKWIKHNFLELSVERNRVRATMGLSLLVAEL